MSLPKDTLWFRSHVVAYRCGLLNEDDERKFRELLSVSETCRKFWDEYGAELPLRGEDEHPSAALLARWKKARSHIGPAERVLVLGHLAACDDCREDARILGLGSLLQDEPRGDEVGTYEAHAHERKKPTEDAPRARFPKRSGSWRVAGWAIAATIASMVLLNTQAKHMRTVLQQGPTRSAVIPWIEPRLVRGPHSPSVLTISPTARRVLVPMLLPPSLQEDRGISVRVEAPGGRLMTAAEVRADVIQDGRVLLLVESETPLQAATYRVRSTGIGPNGSLEEYEALFTIENSR